MDEQRWDNGRRRPTEDTPLTVDELKMMVQGFVSYPTVYKSALRVGFKPELFNGSGENGLAMFMFLFGSLYNEHNVVTKNMFNTHIRGVTSAGIIPMLPDTREFLMGVDNFVDLAFVGPPPNVDESRAERHYIESILRRFLNARLINAGLKNILGVSNENTSPVEIASLLDQFRRQAQAVKFVGNEAVNAAVMPEIGQKIILPPPASPTTISWIDNYIGGVRSGDVIGLLGPYAGGKTTMLSTIATRLARQYAATNQNKLSVYICYEDGAQKMNWSFYSAAAHVHRDRFKNKMSPEEFWAELSTRETLRAYERDIPSNRNGEIILSETERWLAALPWLNQHFTFLDFSASAETNYRGNGGVHEIVATLENLRDRTQMDIGLVCIDYASLMINRELAQNPLTRNVDQVWRQLQSLPDELKTHVAVPFGATVFLAHQLAQGDIKSIPPYRYVSHGDAQGSKAFGENVHACICLNKPDPETWVSTIHWSKIRFDRPSCGPYGLVKIDENVVDVWQADDEYQINDIARKIVRRGEMMPVAAPASAGRPSRRIMNPENSTPDVDHDFLS
jgi:hypothetical protein